MKTLIHRLFVPSNLPLQIALALLLLGGTSARANLAKNVINMGTRLIAKKEVEQLVALARRNPTAAEWLCRAFGREGADRFLLSLSPTAREWISRLGPRAAAVYCELGESATPLLEQFGPSLLRVFEVEGKQTAQWVQRFGADGVRCAGRIGARQTEALAARAGVESLPTALRASRASVALMQKHPPLVPVVRAAIKEGSESTLISSYERGGERFLKFLERNWRGAGVAALCTAFAVHPDGIIRPITESIADIVNKVVGHVAHPESLGGACLMLLIFLPPLLILAASIGRILYGAGNFSRRILRSIPRLRERRAVVPPR